MAIGPDNPEWGSLTAFPADGIAEASVRERDLHLAVGMFDGVHLGHQAVIHQAIGQARLEDGHLAAVLTFDPHPSRILHPDAATLLLMPLRQRVQDMLRVGADCVFVQAFTRDYARQEASSFLPGLARQFPSLRSIHVGENFRFGAGRRGNIDTLRESASALGISVHALERQRMEGMAISSSRIRAAMMEGSIHEVNAMLGHPYFASGRIIQGKGLGRTMNIPTLNLPWRPEVLPRFGVYRVRLTGSTVASPINGVANYGLRPTVDCDEDPLLEVHLLDASGEAIPDQGDSVRVEFLEFVRPERTFDSIDSLREQIVHDIAEVRARLADETSLPPE